MTTKRSLGLLGVTVGLAVALALPAQAGVGGAVEGVGGACDTGLAKRTDPQPALELPSAPSGRGVGGAMDGVGGAVDGVGGAIEGVGGAVEGVGGAVDGVGGAADGVGGALDLLRQLPDWMVRALLRLLR